MPMPTAGGYCRQVNMRRLKSEPVAANKAPVSRVSQSSEGQPLRDIPPHVTKNIEEIVRLDSRDRLEMNPSDHFADLITKFSGSMLFVCLHIVWFVTWIVLNGTGVLAFDNYPFGFLTIIVSLEAIFLSTFVLISQNRQAMQSDRRAKVDLQVNLISEQEITKMMSLVVEMHDLLGLGGEPDPVLEHMQRDTHVQHLADAVHDLEAGQVLRRAAEPDRPGSA